MLTVLYAVCALSGWVALARLAWKSRESWTPPRTAMITAFGFMAIGMSIWTLTLIVSPDAVQDAELARLGAHLCVMAIVATASFGLLHMAYPKPIAWQRSRWRIAAAALAAALLIGLYLRVRGIRPPVHLNVEDARHVAVTAYLTVYLATVAGYATDITRLLWRLAAITTRPWLNHGLRIAAVGAAVGIPYAVSKAAYAVGFWLRLDPPGEHTTTGLLLTISSLLFATGVTMPAWGPTVDSARQWRGRLRAYRQLEPLWYDLTSALPHLVLDGARQHHRRPLRGLGFALQRRIVEISDARLTLRAYTDTTVTEQARHTGTQQGLRDQDLDTYVEAARITAGIAALRANQPAQHPDDHTPYDPPGDYDDQLAWLARIARAYRHQHGGPRPADVATSGPPSAGTP